MQFIPINIPAFQISTNAVSRTPTTNTTMDAAQMPSAGTMMVATPVHVRQVTLEMERHALVSDLS